MVDYSDSESQNMIKCCSCEGWQHIKCLPYTKTQVKLLTSDEIIWKCDACCKLKSKTILIQHNSLTQDNHSPLESNFEQTMRQFMLNINTQMNTVLESLKLKADKSELVVIKQDIQQVNNRISTLEVSKQPSNTAGIETMISEALIGEREKERRKLNLMVGGIPESISHVPEDRQRDDEAKLTEAFHSIGAYVVPESLKSFGKVNPDKPRLLMVKMLTMKDKGQTLKSAWKLNNCNATKKLVHQARSHQIYSKREEGSWCSKASGKACQCSGPRRLEDRLQKIGGGSQASAANTKPIASASTNVNIVNNVHNELNVWYTNSDQFLNKIDELKLRIYN